MENNMLYLIFGWLGSIGLILGYLPQAIPTIVTRWFLHDGSRQFLLYVSGLDALHRTGYQYGCFLFYHQLHHGHMCCYHLCHKDAQRPF